MKNQSKFLILTFLPFLFLLNSCGEKERLKAELAKAQAALDSTNVANTTMLDQFGEIDIMLDSIESSQDVLNFNLELGTTYEDYNDRLNNINSNIENTKSRLKELEDQLAKSDGKNQTLSGMINKLRKSLDEKEKNIVELSAQVERFKTENDGLISTVELQKQQLAEQELAIQKKQEELMTLEEKIEALGEEAVKKEADSYFARAEKTEEVASKIKLAPKKKKEALQEAYDLYKKSFELGKTEAFAKMEALEDKL